MIDHSSAGRFSTGGVISKAFSIYFQNIVTFVPLSLIAFLPVWIGLLVLGDDAAGGPDGTGGGAWVLMALGLLSGYWLQAALVYGTISTMRGRSPGMGETFSKSLGALAAVVVLGIVISILVGIGFVLIIVPGVILMVMFFVAIPAAVVERGGIGASLTRSRELTAGHRWGILALIIVMGILMVLAALVIGMVFGVGAAAAGEAISGPGLWINQLFSMLIGGVWATLIAVAYHDLRVAKEGGGTEQIAQAFD